MAQTWHPDNIYIEKFGLCLTLLIALCSLTLAIVYFLVLSISFLTYLVISIAMFLMIYSLGKLYGELTITRDFIQITDTTIEFRQVSRWSKAWLPVHEKFDFSMIEFADLLKAKDRGENGSSIILSSQKEKQIIGSRYSPESIGAIGLALLPYIKFTPSLKEYLGISVVETNYPRSDIVEIAKKVIMKKMKSYLVKKVGGEETG